VGDDSDTLNGGSQELSRPLTATEAVLRANTTRDAAIDIGEGLVDAFLSGGALDAVPVVRSIMAAIGGVSAISDAMLQRKLNAAVSGFGAATDEDRVNFRSRLDEDDDRCEIGERLLFTIDAVTSTLKAELVGRAFRRHLEGACDKSTLRRTIDAIGQALAEDLSELVVAGPHDLDDQTYQRLAALGLLDGGPENITDAGGIIVATPSGALLL